MQEVIQNAYYGYKGAVGDAPLQGAEGQGWYQQEEESALAANDRDGDEASYGEADQPPLRVKTRAAEEAEYNVLLRALLLAAEKHHALRVSSDVLLAFSSSSAANGTDSAGGKEEKPWLLEVTDGEDDESGITYTVLLPRVRRLLLDAYISPKQLCALADAIACERLGPRAAEREETAAATTTAATDAAARFSSYSLLPFLEELALRGLTMRFGNPSGGGTGLLSESNMAYMTLFRSLRGHPSLRKLDLSGSGVGPMLLPDLQRLVKQTPTLCEIDLSGTRFDESEQEMIAAQCLLNRFRLAKRERAAREGKAAEDHQAAAWMEGLKPWLKAKAVQIMSKRSLDPVLSDRSSLSTATAAATTPYVVTACDEADVDELLYSLYGRRKRAAKGQSSLRKGEGAESNQSSEKEKPKSVNTGENSFDDNTEWKAHSSDAVSASGECWDDEDEETEGTAVNPALTLPYMRYRLPSDDSFVLSRQCMEVIRSAFDSPEVAKRTFLGGREVPRGVPTSFPHMGGGSLGVSRREEVEALKRAMSDSPLLKAIRLTLFPSQPKPRGVFGPGYSNPKHRTTAEENYYATLATQEEQWNVIMEKLVAFAHPAFFYPSTAQDTAAPAAGLCVYERGCLPYWLNYLPKAESAGPTAAISLQFAADEDGTNAAVFTVKEGEFFGEGELLGGTGYHTNVMALLEGNMTTRQMMGGKLKPMFIMKQLQKAREASAVVRLQDAKAAAAPLLVWQIPREVAFFLLNEPYEQYQIYVASSLRLAKVGGGGYGIPASLCPMIACLMEQHVVVRRSGRKEMNAGTVTVADSGSSSSKESDVVAKGDGLRSDLFVLQAGEYTLCSYAANGKWTERLLLPGNVVVYKEFFEADAAARKRQEVLASGGAAGGAVAAGKGAGTAAVAATMGKDAALRQFREEKWRDRLAAAESHSGSSTATAASEHREPTLEAPLLDEEGGEQILYLGRIGSSTATGVWRYYTMPSERFACLPENARLALTSNAVVVECLL